MTHEITLGFCSRRKLKDTVASSVDKAIGVVRLGIRRGALETITNRITELATKVCHYPFRTGDHRSSFVYTRIFQSYRERKVWTNNLENSDMCLSLTASIVDLPVAPRPRILRIRTDHSVSPGQSQLQRTCSKHSCAPENSIPWKRAGVVAQNSRQSPPFGRLSR